LRQHLDSGWIRQRLEEPDQHLSTAQALRLLTRRLPNLHDRVGVPHLIRELCTGLAVRLVGKRCSDPGAPLDDDLEPACDELRHGFRDERHSTLARLDLPRSADSHGASLRTLPALTHFIAHYGLWFLFGIVCLESAGLWVPGETALIAAGVYASKGHLSITAVIVIAAAAAIIGDNIGYWLGRELGRRLIYRYAWIKRIADRVMPPAERFFERHGGKAVFFARFFGGVRVTGAWMAGITRMSWWRFLFWNALGGIVWAAAVGLIAFYAGKAAADAIARYGVYGGIAIGVLIVLAITALHLVRRRAEQT
jgi:membrane protein DedA with SNARE-associated domain